MSEPFDAIVGRYVLQFLADPPDMYRRRERCEAMP